MYEQSTKTGRVSVAHCKYNFTCNALLVPEARKKYIFHNRRWLILCVTLNKFWWVWLWRCSWLKWKPCFEDIVVEGTHVITYKESLKVQGTLWWESALWAKCKYMYFSFNRNLVKFCLVYKRTKYIYQYLGRLEERKMKWLTAACSGWMECWCSSFPSWRQRAGIPLPPEEMVGVGNYVGNHVTGPFSFLSLIQSSLHENVPPLASFQQRTPLPALLPCLSLHHNNFTSLGLPIFTPLRVFLSPTPLV